MEHELSIAELQKDLKRLQNGIKLYQDIQSGKKKDGLNFKDACDHIIEHLGPYYEISPKTPVDKVDMTSCNRLSVCAWAVNHGKCQCMLLRDWYQCLFATNIEVVRDGIADETPFDTYILVQELQLPSYDDMQNPKYCLEVLLRRFRKVSFIKDREEDYHTEAFNMWLENPDTDTMLLLPPMFFFPAEKSSSDKTKMLKFHSWKDFDEYVVNRRAEIKVYLDLLRQFQNDIRPMRDKYKEMVAAMEKADKLREELTQECSAKASKLLKQLSFYLEGATVCDDSDSTKDESSEGIRRSMRSRFRSR